MIAFYAVLNRWVKIQQICSTSIRKSANIKKGRSYLADLKLADVWKKMPELLINQLRSVVVSPTGAIASIYSLNGYIAWLMSWQRNLCISTEV